MYNDNERALIWLNNFVNISTKKKLALLDLFDSPYEMFEEFLNFFLIIVHQSNNMVSSLVY